jgi:ribosomal protein L14E/L6E/L27E
MTAGAFVYFAGVRSVKGSRARQSNLRKVKGFNAND